MKVQISKKLLEHNEIFNYYVQNKRDTNIIHSSCNDLHRMEIEIELVDNNEGSFSDTLENLKPYKYNIHPQTVIYGPMMYIEERTVFLGEYTGGKRQGLGLQIFEDGSLYEGEFKNDQAQGRGRIIFEEGDVYEGEIDNFEMHGFGVYYRAIGDKMKGSFYRDQPHGKMKVEYKDGARFEGEYLSGKKNGSGLFIFADGTYYEGCFKDDFFQGKGMFTNNTDGTKFEGNWEANTLQSPATIKYSDGSVYNGGVENYQKHGDGTLVKLDTKYTGKWYSDLLEGLVLIQNLADGSRKTALYKNGKFNEFVVRTQMNISSEKSELRPVGSNEVMSFQSDKKNQHKKMSNFRLESIYDNKNQNLRSDDKISKTEFKEDEVTPVNISDKNKQAMESKNKKRRGCFLCF